jgi:hypothetical protein
MQCCGDSEARTEPYLNTVKGVLELATQQCAKSASHNTGFARIMTGVAEVLDGPFAAVQASADCSQLMLLPKPESYNCQNKQYQHWPPYNYALGFNRRGSLAACA